MAGDRQKIGPIVCSLSSIIVGITTWNSHGYPVTAVLAKVSGALGCLVLLLAIAGKAPLKRHREENAR